MKGAFAALVVFVAAALAYAPEPPAQPVPFGHKQHVSLGLKCADCHTAPDPGEVMTFPSVSKCMVCHRTIKTDAPGVLALKKYAAANEEVPWVRVYQIPSWVYFSHAVHTDAGVTCDSCHGAVAQRDRLAKETDLSMAGCMNCHRVRKATLDCAGCHEAKS
ncbi:MAG: cytochrome c3 family protein [Acidobacteriaceae bacterium]|nr:cytochrome c3 family protein [Acidobacteriaceae bacterium]